jgi:hypothetical protein
MTLKQLFFNEADGDGNDLSGGPEGATFDDGAEESQDDVGKPGAEGSDDSEASDTGQPEGGDQARQEEDEPELTPEQLEEQRQAAIQKRINKITKEKYDAQREADALRERLEKSEQPGGAVQPGPDGLMPDGTAPIYEVPEVPDYYSMSSGEYDQAIKQREQIIAYNAKAEIHNQNVVEKRQEEQRRLQEKTIESVNKQIETYAERSKEIGIKPEELQQYGKTCADFGIYNQVTMEILKEENGPLITKYLSQNPQEIERLNGIQDQGDLAREVIKLSSKAKRLKPRKSSTPPPTDSVDGGTPGGDHSNYHFSDGATFE